MAGKAWHLDHVKEQTDRAKGAVNNLDVAAREPKGLTIADVDASVQNAKEAIERAAHSVRVIVSEEGA